MKKPPESLTSKGESAFKSSEKAPSLTWADLAQLKKEGHEIKVIGVRLPKLEKFVPRTTAAKLNQRLAELEPDENHDEE